LKAIDLHHRYGKGPNHPATCRMTYDMGIQGIGKSSDRSATS
jgi:hypothetical protein